MPYKSQAQAAYFNANKEKLEAEGVDVEEWNKATRLSGKKLPKRVPKKPKFKQGEKKASVIVANLGRLACRYAKRHLHGN